jgi:polyisoprenoid-binding protein YceI
MTTTDIRTPVTSLTGDYDLDPTHSRLGFAARHAMVTTVRGQFGNFTADVHLDEENVSNVSARLEIQAASVTTGNPDRDAHLHSADFFDVANHPTITFVSTSAERTGDDEFALTGDLTIKGISRPVTVTFEKTGAAVDPWGGSRVGFEGRAQVNRKDWDLTWNVALEAGGILVSDKVTLEFDISAVRRTS